MEGPDSYWVKVGGTLVRRNRKHLRRVPQDTVGGPPEVQGAEVGPGTGLESAHSGDVSRSSRIRRDNCDPI